MSHYLYISSSECEYFQDVDYATDRYQVNLPHEIKLDENSNYQLCLVEAELDKKIRNVYKTKDKEFGAYLGCDLVKTSFVEQGFYPFLRKIIFKKSTKYSEYFDRIYIDLVPHLKSIKIFNIYITSCEYTVAPYGDNTFYLLLHLKKI